jgi:hypothetical protein
MYVSVLPELPGMQINFSAPYYTVICGMSDFFHIFQYYVTNSANFGKKKLLHIKFVF